MSKELNGWDVQAMNEAVGAVREQPEAGKLTWRSTVNWDGGFGVDVHTREIEQQGQVMRRRFTMRGDHPPELLGQNTGPSAIETVMAALGSCMAGSYAAQATARGVELEGLQVDLACDIDLNGFFGLQPVFPGLSQVQLTFRPKSKADAKLLKEIAEAAQTLSPVFNTVTKPVGVRVGLAPA